MLAGEAKAMDRALISSVFPLTGNAALTKALAPPVNIAMESVKALEDQTAVSSTYLFMENNSAFTLTQSDVIIMLLSLFTHNVSVHHITLHLKLKAGLS